MSLRRKISGKRIVTKKRHNYRLYSEKSKNISHSVVSNSFANPWTVACHAPLSMGFFRQEYWSELPFPSPGDLPDPGIEPGSPAM